MKALRYHARRPAGKIQVVPSKPCETAEDLALAYTPGVARPCLAIHRHPEAAYRYTGKGNLIAIVSNGTAVLGLGNLGPLAAKPVMEGKALLFKRLADIDAFDLEIDVTHPEEIVRVVKAIAPTFGGINLEDIKAPECFVVEERLRAELPIPVFHDDQHGTAIIVGAAFLNGLEIQGKSLADVRVVIAGAGAAGIACAEMACALGLTRDQIVLADSHGVVHAERHDLNPYKRRFARVTGLRTLSDALRGTDVFIGVSGPGIVDADMLHSMADRPLVFALANPEPEIGFELVSQIRRDAIFASGRSDWPNQVNNVLAFPAVFRAALDVRATKIDWDMKLAASRALAALARESPEFSANYIIPRPLDPSVLPRVASAVAAAAGGSGAARRPVTDLTAYATAVASRIRDARRPVPQAESPPRRFQSPDQSDAYWAMGESTWHTRR
jgi:malate dehydrogenase (oxaloacetate-decarboxylating)(NADP+)